MQFSQQLVLQCAGEVNHSLGEVHEFVTTNGNRYKPLHGYINYLVATDNWLNTPQSFLIYRISVSLTKAVVKDQ